MIEASISKIQASAVDAYLSGKSLSANPYPADTSAYRTWNDAYMLVAFEQECA